MCLLVIGTDWVVSLTIYLGFFSKFHFRFYQRNRDSSSCGCYKICGTDKAIDNWYLYKNESTRHKSTLYLPRVDNMVAHILTIIRCPSKSRSIGILGEEVLIMAVHFLWAMYIETVAGHNGHKPNRPQPKRPQTGTATNRNGHKRGRPQTETATNRNGHEPKKPQTETATNQISHKPERPHEMIHQYIAGHIYDIWAT